MSLPPAAAVSAPLPCPPDVLIRRAELSDLPALADLYLHVRRNTFSWLPPERFQREDFFRDSQGELVWVATRAGTLVGFASVYSESAFLHSLYVHPTAQRTGIGRLLLAQVVRTTPGRVTLKCLTFNRAAQAFYLAQGWAIIGSGENAQGPHLTFEAPACRTQTDPRLIYDQSLRP